MFRLRPWEDAIHLSFDPLRQVKRDLSWVNVRAEPYDSAHKGLLAEDVFAQAQDGIIPSLPELRFQDPGKFVAGQLNEHVLDWEFILEQTCASEEMHEWIRQGIDIYQYIKPFQGSFGGKVYNHEFPPHRMLNNSSKCKPFVEFITSTILERLRNGSLECVGKVGEVKPPHIVSPLTVEPSKPRLCINLMYLNNWIKDVGWFVA